MLRATVSKLLLQEVRDAVAAAGPDQVAVIIAEPVQKAGGCLDPATRLLARPAQHRRRARHPARCRLGDLRLRPPRQLARDRAGGGCARHGHDREGHHVGVRADGCGVRARPHHRGAAAARGDTHRCRTPRTCASTTKSASVAFASARSRQLMRVPARRASRRNSIRVRPTCPQILFASDSGAHSRPA